MKKIFVAVGAGGRIPMFIDPIAGKYREVARLKALCDSSLTRMEYHRRRLLDKFGADGIELYPPEAFDRMLDEQNPETVIVCTMDSVHHEYVIRALDHGCDVVCEKPLTIDAAKCRAIDEAVKRTGRRVRVTFNYRWSPGVTKVYELLRQGVIGDIKHVSLDYRLDTSHGADYFRRWHAKMSNSGGLLVHKSTHHFDLVNWWIDSIPKEIFAKARLAFYGRKNALARGDEALTRYDRYTGTDSHDDPFRLDLDGDESLRQLYRNAEEDSGYIRDRNVFRDDIDIYDTMSVLATYRNGVSLNYSLNAFCPCEGFHVALTGDKGRLEYSEVHGGHLIKGQSDEEFAAKESGSAAPPPKTLTVRPMFKKAYAVEILEAEGGHGGGDPLIQEQIFATNPPADPFHRSAGHEQGIASAIIGIAANESIASGKVIDVDALVNLPATAKRLSELV